MSEHMLVHLNVERPVVPFSADHPNAWYFLGQLPKVFARARPDGDMFRHTQVIRSGNPLPLFHQRCGLSLSGSYAARLAQSSRRKITGSS